MEHPLEQQYGLTAHELLEALQRRFRARVTLEGAVAEVHMERKIKALVGTAIERYELYDEDGKPDFGIWLPGKQQLLMAECKNVRDADEAYRTGGEIVAYKVETQKTRASRSDPTSHFYDIDQFAMLGVCLGKKTGNWADFVFADVLGLARHSDHPDKLAAIQRVPLPGAATAPWYEDLGELLRQCGTDRSTEQS